MQNHQKPDTRYRTLSLGNMSFSFAVFVIGAGLAICAFAGQIAYYKWIKMRFFITIEDTNSHPIVDGIEEKATDTSNDGKDLPTASDVDVSESFKIDSDADIESAIEEIEENVPVVEVTRRPIDGDAGIKNPKNQASPTKEIIDVTDIETYKEPKMVAMINAFVIVEPSSANEKIDRKDQ